MVPYARRMATAAQPVHGHWARLVDDAAVLPPGSADLDDAVTAHLRRRDQEEWAAVVGALVVTDRDLPGLAEHVPPDDELRVVVDVTGGAGALAPLPRWFADRRLRLVAATTSARDLDDLHGSARRLVVAAQQASYELGDELPLAVRLPTLGAGPWPVTPTPGWLDALDEIAVAGHRLAIDADGPDGPPSAAGLAATIEAALDREVPFTCPRGLDRAVGDTQGHGFLSVLLATRVSLDTGDPERTAEALRTTDTDVVTDRLREVGPDALGRARRWFGSFAHADPEAVWTSLPRP